MRDSGLSDSGYFKSQEMFSKKHKESMRQIQAAAKEELQSRKQFSKKISFWDKLKSFLSL
jgi:hypothetical protein